MPHFTRHSSTTLMSQSILTDKDFKTLAAPDLDVAE